MRTKILIALLFITSQAAGQIINPKETAKRKAEDRTNRGIDRTLDKGLDKVEEGIGSIFKKKDKNAKKDKKSGGKNNPAENEEAGAEEAGNEEAGEVSGSGSVKAGTSDDKKPLKSYSKFDFVPGEKVLGMEDFSQDAVGDFPARWSTNASGEVVSLDGLEGHWLMVNAAGIYFPDFIHDLPENTTLEFDMAVSDGYSEMQSGLKVVLVEKNDRTLMFDQHFNQSAQVGVDIHPFGNSGKGSLHVWVFDKGENKIISNESGLNMWNQGQANRISIWKQKGRFRMYINENKVWDLPKAFDPSVQYSLLFANNPWEGEIFFSNIRVAVGAPDTRNKLLTEGKLVTRGITFDVNSDKIKPESYGTLREIVTVLKENSSVKVKIIGHTDSDGDDKSNLELSKKRAESVKNTLSSEFGIAANRMETDGKGEGEPAEPNTTPQGKANNRRVEFIKL